MRELSTTGVPTLRLELRVKNNRLWTAIFDRWASVAACCRDLKLPQSKVGGFINLRMSPYLKQGFEGLSYPGLCDSAAKLCDEFRTVPEDLFPIDLYRGVLPKALLIAQVSHERLETVPTRALPAGDSRQPDHQTKERELRETLAAVLDELTPREARVIRLRFGINDGIEHTYEEVAQSFGVTSPRIQQIEAKALRKLRQPRRADRIRPLVDFEVSDTWTRLEWSEEQQRAVSAFASSGYFDV